MMTYIAASFALLFCITAMCLAVSISRSRSIKKDYEEVSDRFESEKRVRKRLSRDIKVLREELSKKTVKCRKCGQFHKARKEILSGAMPGETLCGELYCKVYDDRSIGEGA